MGDHPEWDWEDLKEFAEQNPPDLDWLDKPGRHQYRWRTLTGRWTTANRRIKDHRSYLKACGKRYPMDMYVSTSAWLDPTNLPRIRDKSRPHPILLDHWIVFDIDMRPFSRRRLEAARKATCNLMIWMKENEPSRTFSHISFSGGKGFHLFYRDEDRSLFSIPEPKLREEEIRADRKALLNRVIGAGHPVDPLVTADTRRIIRLPSTLHGGTGWVCTRIEEKVLHLPLKDWIYKIPRHTKASRLPRFNFTLPRLPRIRRIFRQNENQINDDGNTSIHLEVSSQVPGTKDRNVFLFWIKAKPDILVERVGKIIDKMNDADIGPCAIWSDDTGALLMVPRAIPTPAFSKLSRRIGTTSFGQRVTSKGHAWIRFSPTFDNSTGWGTPLEGRGIHANEAGTRCKHPWSHGHLLLAERLGFKIEPDGDVSGTPDLPIRAVEIR